ncbi:MAG: hypothetical protein JG777_2321, partial [Clostridia bacterium]|nr:hypothetical protein [Clostridia bacterium]
MYIQLNSAQNLIKVQAYDSQLLLN